MSIAADSKADMSITRNIMLKCVVPDMEAIAVFNKEELM